MSTKSTKKAENEPDTLRTEYRREDLGKGTRGKYTGSFAEGSNLVLLSPDVAKAFPTTDAVNQALRGLMQVARRATKGQQPTPNRHD